MICSRCQQNLAVVFINKLENGKQTTEGLCLKCARELGIKPLEQMMDQFGLSDMDMDELTGEMESLISGLDISDSMTLPANMSGNDNEKSEKKTNNHSKKNQKQKKIKTVFLLN